MRSAHRVTSSQYMYAAQWCMDCSPKVPCGCVVAQLCESALGGSSSGHKLKCTCLPLPPCMRVCGVAVAGAPVCLPPILGAAVPQLLPGVWWCLRYPVGHRKTSMRVLAIPLHPTLSLAPPVAVVPYTACLLALGLQWHPPIPCPPFPPVPCCLAAARAAADALPGQGPAQACTLV